MATTYKSKEVNVQGKIIENNYRAETNEEVIQLIRAKGHTPIKVWRDSNEIVRQSSSIFTPKVKTKDLAVFCKQLNTMLVAGMPLLNSLDVLKSQTENKSLNEAIHGMTSAVQKGEVLSDAMRLYPKVFPSLLIDMAVAGELTGNIDTVLERMTDHYTKENKIQRKIKGAMVYPAFLTGLMLLVVVGLLTFVFPTFITLFEKSGTELPVPTQIVYAVSNSVKSFWYLFLLGIGGIVFSLRSYLKTTDGKRNFQGMLLRIPVVGPSIKKIATSRFTRTLATLLSSGISIIQALETAAAVTQNQIIVDRVQLASEELKKGSSLSNILKNVGLFPKMMLSMISIGEESGSLEEMLDKTADFYDEEMDSAIQRMLSIIEPLLILFMAVVIGFIVIAMMMPIFDLSRAIS